MTMACRCAMVWLCAIVAGADLVFLQPSRAGAQRNPQFVRQFDKSLQAAADVVGAINLDEVYTVASTLDPLMQGSEEWPSARERLDVSVAQLRQLRGDLGRMLTLSKEMDNRLPKEPTSDQFHTLNATLERDWIKAVDFRKAFTAAFQGFTDAAARQSPQAWEMVSGLQRTAKTIADGVFEAFQDVLAGVRKEAAEREAAQRTQELAVAKKLEEAEAKPRISDARTDDSKSLPGQWSDFTSQLNESLHTVQDAMNQVRPLLRYRSALEPLLQSSEAGQFASDLFDHSIAKLWDLEKDMDSLGQLTAEMGEDPTSSQIQRLNATLEFDLVKVAEFRSTFNAAFTGFTSAASVESVDSRAAETIGALQQMAKHIADRVYQSYRALCHGVRNALEARRESLKAEGPVHGHMHMPSTSQRPKAPMLQRPTAPTTLPRSEAAAVLPRHEDHQQHLHPAPALRKAPKAKAHESSFSKHAPRALPVSQTAQVVATKNNSEVAMKTGKFVRKHLDDQSGDRSMHLLLGLSAILVLVFLGLAFRKHRCFNRRSSDVVTPLLEERRALAEESEEVLAKLVGTPVKDVDRHHMWAVTGPPACKRAAAPAVKGSEPEEQSGNDSLRAARSGEDGEMRLTHISVTDVESERRIKIMCPGVPEDAIRMRRLPNGVRVEIKGGMWGYHDFEQDFHYDYQTQGHMELYEDACVYNNGILLVVLKRMPAQVVRLGPGCGASYATTTNHFSSSAVGQSVGEGDSATSGAGPIVVVSATHSGVGSELAEPKRELVPTTSSRRPDGACDHSYEFVPIDIGAASDDANATESGGTEAEISYIAPTRSVE